MYRSTDRFQYSYPMGAVTAAETDGLGSCN